MVSRKSSKKTPQKLNDNTSATQHDLSLWGGELLRRIEEVENRSDQRFEKIETRLDDIDNHLDGIDNRLDGIDNRLDNMETRIITALQAYIEQLMVNREEAHQDELDIITEKREAGAQWKSIPRRLTIVEQKVEHIKDDLANKK